MTMEPSNLDEVAKALTNNCCHLLNDISECCPVVIESFKNLIKTLNHTNFENESDVSKLRYLLFAKYLCGICQFIKDKLDGSPKINETLKNLAICVIEIERTRSLVTKEQKLLEMKINYLKKITEDAVRPNLFNLTTKENDDDSNIDDSEIDEPNNTDGLYAPPKTEYVPYPYENHKKSYKTIKSSQKAVLSDYMHVDDDKPDEIFDITDIMSNKIKNKTAPPDSSVNYTFDDIELEELAAKTQLREKSQTKKYQKRKKLRLIHRKKNRR